MRKKNKTVHKRIKIKKQKDHNKTNTKFRDYNPSFIYIYFFFNILFNLWLKLKKSLATMISDRGKIFDSSVIKHSQEHVLYTVIKV